MNLTSPIAIIGIGCRFPGASGVEQFWHVLRNGLETTADYPGGRLPYVDQVYRVGDAIATRRGGFLADVDRMDAEFFGISPREAALLDPQQRLLLEVAWEAIEDAGIPVEKLAGTRTGVYAGIWTSDYEQSAYKPSGGRDFYATTGSGRYSAAGRLAYFFDLRGPNLALDTACSSSLVAIHLACQSLRLGESEMALAGGANVILSPEITLTYSAANMLSPEGRSKFGDASADGYVRSEGAAMLLLKPLGRALYDRDPIYAVIRGSAVNNDGHSSGLLVAPSRDGQEALLRAAFRNANIDPGQVDYIEAHGTGTLVGDPVEIETIGRVVDTPARRRRCSIGSVKTNIGHTESVAGAAGVIKVALALERGVLPASLHFNEPNPAIAWDSLPLTIPRSRSMWPHAGPQRVAGVSGFGITGTNAHVVLENLITDDEASPVRLDEAENRPNLFVLSGHSANALRAVAKTWLDRLQTDGEWPSSLVNLAYTAAVRHTHQEFRLTIVAASRTELEEKLASWLGSEETDGVKEGRRRVDAHRKAVFVFPGQGGQWSGMARELLSEPVFRATLECCDGAIRKYTGWSVIEGLMAESAEMGEDVSIVQPCLFAVTVALAALWRSWGIEPQAVVGHSMGECAAAAVSGCLSLDDAAAVICHRSRLMKRVSGRGLMMFAELTFDESTLLAQRYEGRLSVAANNGPASTVLSGDPEAVEEVIRQLTEQEIFCRRIKVDVASHSFQMEPMRAELEESLHCVSPRAGSISMYSTTTGCIEDGTGLDASYWGRNLRQPVLFSAAIQKLLGDEFDTFVEIGPHPILLQPVESNIQQAGVDAVAVPSTRRDRSELGAMLTALGALHASGFPVDFRKLYPEGECLRLPPYPWQRERYWIETDDLQLHQFTGLATSSPARPTGLYEIQWVERETPKAGGKNAFWIVLSAHEEVAGMLAESFRTNGQECAYIANTAELERALRGAATRCRGVIRIANAAGTEPASAVSDALEITRVVRTATANTDSPRMWLVSRGVWSLPGDRGEISAAQSAAWGLGRVIEWEYPELRCVNVDLPEMPQAGDFDVLARLVAYDGPDEQCAIRSSKQFVARYEAIQRGDDTKTSPFRADASYLITGGMGGIGLPLAQWMARNGARHIALAARSAPNEAVLQRIAAIENEGVSIQVFCADMAKDADVRRVLTTIGNDLPRLKGVFHLAATYEPGLLADLDAEALERVMRSKAESAWLLDQHLADADLEFFTLFSSVAAAIGQPGLGSYASANAYIEALARKRRTQGVAAQSIAWGSWESVGMSANDNVSKGVRSYQQMGIYPITVESALADLGRIMTLNAVNVLALPVDWTRFAQSFGDAAPPRVFEQLIPKREEATEAKTESIRIELEAIEPVRRRRLLETHLTEKLAAVLKTDAARIDPAKPFGLLGVDSLMALELVRRLAVTTGLRLRPVVVFNYPTVQALAREIAKRMGMALEEATTAVAPRQMQDSSPVGVALEALTEEDAIAALMGKDGAGR